MSRKWFTAMIIGVSLAFTSCQTNSLRQGDLLFHVTPQSNAITEVTAGMIDHVAIVINSDSVIEAVGQGVVITPLDSLRHQEGHYLVGRVKKIDSKRSVENARQYLGRPYDRLYLADNDAIYCSELVQFAFVDRQGQPLFLPVPMSFHDASGHITDYWRHFYEQHQMEVPEGQPGTNPAELSKRKNVRIKGKL